MNLANLADAYNPLLLITSIALAIYYGFKFKSARGLILAISAIIVYAIMFLDKKYLLWASAGLDYSTHTATALAMCMFIGALTRGLFIKTLLVFSLFGYGELMVVLGYHTWLDIFSTAIPIGLILFSLYYFTRKNKLLTINTETTTTHQLGME